MIEDEALHFDEVRVLYTDFKVGLYVYTEYQYTQMHAGVCVFTCIIYKMIPDTTKQFMKQIWQQEQERGHAVVLFSQLCTRIGLACHVFYTHLGKWKDETYFTFWRVLNQTHILDLTTVSAGIVETASPVKRRIQKPFHLGRRRRQNMTVYVMYLVVQNQHLEVQI